MGQKKQQHFSEEFRREVVLRVLKGEINKEQAQKRYGIGGRSLILKWINNFEKYGVCTIRLAKNPQSIMPKEKKTEKPAKELELEARNKLLEQRLKDESLLREMYSRMIDIAEQEYKIPIRKKSNTK